MGNCVSKKSSKASTARQGSKKSAAEPTSVTKPISESKSASDSVSEPIAAPRKAADDAQTAEEVLQVKYSDWAYNIGPTIYTLVFHSDILKYSL